MERASADGELWSRGYALWVAAISHLHLGDLPRARAAIAETMRIEQDFRDGVCTALRIEVCSWVVSASGRAADAAALSGMAASVWRRLGTSLHAFGPHATTEGNRHSSLIDDQLGTSCAAAIRAEYGQVSVQEAVRLGIEIGVDGAGDDETARPLPQPGSRSPRASSPLTDRERQIAALIADGMSNRDIAAELTISVRTVDGHVERILRKLDFGSRTQVASWMAAAARVRS
ncbi:MAG: helix-turn-helix transcriptional regulator [Pseudonocardia sp.]|nr:helix-turn-helix transcriptional regulator [Pseudonocardia sp.]